METRKLNISGVRFHHQFPGEKRGQGTCFEDLPEWKQDEILDQLTPKRVRLLAKQMTIALKNYVEFSAEVAQL